MDEFEEMHDNKKELKLPKDLDGDDEEEQDYDHEVDDDEEAEEDLNEPEDNKEKDDDIENELFAMARENKEMKFANEEMLEKIGKIEDEMMDKKKWQLKGEVQCKDRNYNSLLEEYVDFDTATKLPPQITKETTMGIEATIKQRILDEMFDDPIRKVMKGDKGKDDFTLEFTKSGKGLGEEYADEYARKLYAQNKDVFDESDLTGADSALKHEIEDLFTGLMRNLSQLSNIHFTPKRLTKQTNIRTQNVPALKMEEAIPIGVSTGNTKSAREVFEINPKALRDKDELSKEERRRERAHRKRSIKTHLKHKETNRKEKNREQGLGLVGDRFLVKQV